MVSSNKRGSVTKCGNTKCKSPVQEEGIMCDTCAKWYHPHCGNLKKVEFNLYIKHDCLNWVCQVCKELIKKVLKPPSSKVSPSTIAVGSSPGHSLINKSRETQRGSPSRNASLAQSCTLANQRGDELAKNPKGKLEQRSEKSCKPLNIEVGSVSQTIVAQTEFEVTKNSPDQSMGVRGKVATNKKVSESAATQSSGSSGLEKGSESLQGLGECLTVLKNQVIELDRRLERSCSEQLTLKSMVNNLENKSDIALARNRKLVIYGIPEPHLINTAQRERALRHHVVNVLRTANIPEYVPIRRCLRLGVWKLAVSPSSPRPVLVEFIYARHRDLLLGANASIRTKTNGTISVKPDMMKADILDKKMKSHQVMHPVVCIKKLDQLESATVGREDSANSQVKVDLLSPSKNGPAPGD